MGALLAREFVCTYRRVGTLTIVVDEQGRVTQKLGGNVAGFLCTPRGEVLSYVTGGSTPEVVRRQAQLAVDLWRRGLAAGDTHPVRMAGVRHALKQRLGQAPHHLRERLLEPLELLAPVVWRQLLGQPLSDEGPKRMTLTEAEERGLLSGFG